LAAGGFSLALYGTIRSVAVLTNTRIADGEELIVRILSLTCVIVGGCLGYVGYFVGQGRTKFLGLLPCAIAILGVYPAVKGIWSYDSKSHLSIEIVGYNPLEDLRARYRDSWEQIVTLRKKYLIGHPRLVEALQDLERIEADLAKAENRQPRPLERIAPIAEAILKPGQRINIEIVDEPDLSHAGLVIPPNGTIHLRYVGKIVLVGKTCAEAEQEIREKLSPFLNNSQVRVERVE
jgi:hypothetical protein